METGQTMKHCQSPLLLALLVLASAATGCLTGSSSVNDVQAAHMPVETAPTATPTATVMPVISATPTPAPAPEPPAAVASAISVEVPEEQYSRTYEWEYGNVAWSFTAVVEKKLYEHFKSKPHAQDIGYSTYALASEDRDCLRSTAQQFQSYGGAYGYSRYDDAANVVAFVQSLPYAGDGPARGPRYPLETLVDQGGDCEDKTVLAAALLHEMGFDVAFLKLPGHLALGIGVPANGACFTHGGTTYYYAEVSGTGWEIGEVPEELKSQAPAIVPLVKRPAVTLRMSALPAGQHGGIVDYRVAYTLHNDGPGTAGRLKLQVRALAPGRGDNVIWAPERTVELSGLGEGASVQGDVLLSVPAGERSRVVGILSGDNVDPVQESTPEFTAGA
jgi:hypothetical protein